MEFTTSDYTFDPPEERFNLLDLDENEIYLKSLSVVMNDFTSEDFIPGMLHLNSRSIIFDPDNEASSLIKIRYNSHFEFECISHEQVRGIYDMINATKSSISHIDTSTGAKKGSKVTPRKKEGGPKRGKPAPSGKSLTSYLDKHPSFKSIKPGYTSSKLILTLSKGQIAQIHVIRNLR